MPLMMCRIPEDRGFRDDGQRVISEELSGVVHGVVKFQLSMKMKIRKGLHPAAQERFSYNPERHKSNSAILIGLTQAVQLRGEINTS